MTPIHAYEASASEKGYQILALRLSELNVPTAEDTHSMALTYSNIVVRMNYNPKTSKTRIEIETPNDSVVIPDLLKKILKENKFERRREREKNKQIF